MKKLLLCVIIVLFCALTACSNFSNQQRSRQINEWLESDRIKVLTTTCFVRDLVENIGGDRVSVIEMIPMTSDPHSYQPTKVDLELLDNASYVIVQGLGLEHKTFNDALLSQTKKPCVLQEYLMENCPGKLIKHEDTGQYDPHIWMDLNLWSECGRGVLQYLETVDPENRDYYKKRAHHYFKSLDSLDMQILEQYAIIPDHLKYLVSAHDAFGYYTKRYFRNGKDRDQHRNISIWGLSPEASLSVKDLDFVLSLIKKYKIKVVFTERNLSFRALQRLKEVEPNIQICLEPLYSDNFSLEVDDVEELLKYNTRVITENIKEKGENS